MELVISKQVCMQEDEVLCIWIVNLCMGEAHVRSGGDGRTLLVAVHPSALKTVQALQDSWTEQVCSSGTSITHCLWPCWGAEPGDMETRLYSLL